LLDSLLQEKKVLKMEKSETEPQPDQKNMAEERPKTNMVFLINKIPEQVKSGLDDGNMEKFIESKLVEKGIEVVRVERGMKKERRPHLHDLAFISIKEQDEEKIADFVQNLNSDNSWECFEVARKRRFEKSTGPRMNAVFLIDKIPEDVKAGIDMDNIAEFVENKLKEREKEVLRIRRGHTRFENMVFLSIKHEDEDTLPEMLQNLNEDFWDGFVVSKDWWKEQNAKIQKRPKGERLPEREQDLGPEPNMVFFINKIPEDVKKEMINDDTMMSMDFEKLIEGKLTEKGLEVEKCKQGGKASHILFITVKVEDKETLPNLVEDLNKEFWDCFEVGNKKRKNVRVHCDICDVTVKNEILMEVHKKGKAHLKKMKKVDENGQEMTFKCDICRIQTNDKNGLDIHMKGKNHMKKVAQAAKKTFRCDLCAVVLNSESGMAIHIEGKQHKKKAEGNPEYSQQVDIPALTTNNGAPQNIVKIENVLNNTAQVTNNIAQMTNNTAQMANIAIAAVPKPKPGSFNCELCGISTTSSKGLDMHLMGKNHKKKLSNPGMGNGAKRKMQENNGDAMEDAIEQEIKKIKHENGTAMETQ